MIKTKKPGVLHNGKVRKTGELLTLDKDSETRLVAEGWATFVESWPAGPEAEEPHTSAPEETPNTSASEEEDTPKKARGRRK